MGPEAKQNLKDRVKTLINKKPRSMLGSPADPTGITIMDEGVVTGDEAPFSFAAGQWSNVKFEKDGRTIRPNMRFDFEVSSAVDTSHISRSWSHFGISSYRMSPSEEYSPAVRRHIADVATTLSAVEVGFWMWSPSPKTLVTAVVSIDGKSKQLAWFGKDLPADTSCAKGSRLNCSFLLRDLPIGPNDMVSVYLWKRGGAEAFIDDMDIYFQSAEVPGRRIGKAYALDSAAVGGQAPMGYAEISVKDIPVDSTRFLAGMTSMPTTVVPVRIGDSDWQWRFVPEEGTAYLLDADGTPTNLLRPRSLGSRTDITHFDRIVAETKPKGILLTGFDVNIEGGKEVIASMPQPMSLLLDLAPAR